MQVPGQEWCNSIKATARDRYPLRSVRKQMHDDGLAISGEPEVPWEVLHVCVVRDRRRDLWTSGDETESAGKVVESVASADDLYV